MRSPSLAGSRAGRACSLAAGLIALVAVFVWAPRSIAAAAAESVVTAPEVPIRSAPFEVAPTLLRVRAGERLTVDEQARGGWLQVRLPDGRFGYVRAGDVSPPVSLAPAPVPAPPPAERPAVGAGAGVGDSAPRSPDAVAPSPDAASVAGAPPPPDAVASPAAVGGSLAPIVAQPETAPPAPASGPSGDLSLLGVMFEILPVGTLSLTSSTATNGASRSTDSVFAVAVAPFLDVPVSPTFSLGGSPQVIFRVKGDGEVGRSATEIDLRARLTARLPMSPRVRVFGRWSPAISILAIPSSASGSAPSSNPTGFLMDFAVGTEVALLPNLWLAVDLGYQVGFQSKTYEDGSHFDGTSYLHLGGGLAIGL